MKTLCTADRMAILEKTAEMIDAEMVFSAYDVFQEVRDELDYEGRYRDVSKEVKKLVRQAVDDAGTYKCRYVSDGQYDVVYLQFVPEDFEEYDDSDTEEDEDEDQDYEDDDEDTDDEDSDEDEDTDDDDETDEDDQDSECQIDIMTDGGCKIFVGPKVLAEANLDLDNVVVNYFSDGVTISNDEISYADGSRYVENAENGIRISLKRYMENVEPYETLTMSVYDGEIVIGR